MAGPVQIELDLSPGHLLRWLATELARPGAPPLVVRTTRDWRVETVVPPDDTPLDQEDELTAHVALGTLELAPPDRCWRLTMDVTDPLGGNFADDWPPETDGSDGPEEISLNVFCEGFATDDLDAAVTLEAASPAARRKADRLIARILSARHASGR